ncbi:YVTN repeat-like/Quino protein amine dehydrogenase [Trichodelitschia bisporula]|uniref:YVTN repeat-like/Quino protein amine dehydrogenase n=1 Tax=Trichodelitschia bisporula TaxID=703511 RepID=A0A6G1HQG3_9PEZI|nr:YVTN repeat-like/Quino protein amine dehydrogenase [Trichodelitschia bisporula]
MNVRQPLNFSEDPIVLGVELNDESKIFTVGIPDGYKVYDAKLCRLIYTREFGGSISYASTLLRTPFVGIIGGGPSPYYPPNKFVLWNDKHATEAFKIEFSATPIRACLTKNHLAMVFEEGVTLNDLQPYFQDNRQTKRLGIYDTASNPRGLCCLGQKRLIFPGRTKGQVQIVHIGSKTIDIIPAHTSALSALALSKDETLLATTSDTGTLIRVWSVASKSRLHEFRRGLDPATIFSLAFSPSARYLAVTSDKSTLHIFDVPSHAPDSHPPTPEPVSRPKRHSNASLKPRTASVSKPRRPTPPPPVDDDDFGLDALSFSEDSLSTSETGSPHATLPPSIIEPPHSPSGPRRPSSHLSSSPDVIKAADTAGYMAPQKYGALASLPYAPRILSDTYSSMSCRFEIGDERSRGKGPGEKGMGPAKGVVGWLEEDVLVVVGAGEDARWEKFRVGMDGEGKKAVGRVGWRKYLEEDGLD